jgi:hypothetical protein
MNTGALSEITAIPPNFAQHLNEHMHTFGPVDNIMQILYYQEIRPTLIHYRTLLHQQRSRK